MRPDISSFNAITNLILRVGLLVLAVLTAFFGTVYTLVSILSTRPALSEAPRVIFFFLCGWSVAALLASLAKMLQWHGFRSRQQHEQLVALHAMGNSLKGLESAIAALPAAAPAAVEREPVAPLARLEPPVSPQPAALPENVAGPLIALLTQIRDLTMMSETQRQQLAQSHWNQIRRQHQEIIERCIGISDWAGAQAEMDALRAALPDDPLTHKLSEQLSSRRAAIARQDIDGYRAQIEHLMSITAWTQAQEQLRNVQQRYPGEPMVEKLAADVQREKEAFEKENYGRLLIELRDASDRREWRRAYEAAVELIRRYPTDRKVEKLRNEQLETLKENAEAQERKEEESLFKDLLQRQRYEDAAEVARRVIGKYPSSSAAMELSRLLPKVDELMRQEQLKRSATMPELRI